MLNKMVFTLDEWKKQYNSVTAKRDDEQYMHKRADLDINGSDKYYEKLGELCETNPILSGPKGLRGKSEF